MSENDLSRKIRELRALHGLTLEQVAQQVGVGKSTVRKWETGYIENMRRDKIAKLATALHTSPSYLMGWADSSSATPPLASQPSKELTTEEQHLIQSFRSLNTEGRQKILDYTADLCASGRYIKTASDSSLPKQA